ncbi:MAG: hypothetical protein KAU31_01970, partial [Spirochaetaceae bacterium]|nr:hypothetical protein [Spirochaetaceae bacterium]
MLNQVKKHSGIVIALLILVGLYLTSRYSFLLFHSLAEIFSIVVAFSIFVIAWNSRSFMNNNYLLFVGVAYLFVGGIDLIHTLGYSGMGVFPNAGADMPTQLWIAGRFMESISLLIAPAMFARKIRARLVLLAYAVVTGVLLTSVLYWDIFPSCYVDGSGLTLFKIAGEYVIMAILAAAGVLLHRRREHFEPQVRKWIYASLALTICAELAFTFYISVFGISNLVGHFFKLFSFYFIYRALIETGLTQPFSLLVRDLKKTEESLRTDKQKLEEALQNAKILRGLLPICSVCKKIRDDEGYWSQLETYIDAHSEAKFSHGICPDCAKKLYPDYFESEASAGTEIPGNS